MSRKTRSNLWKLALLSFLIQAVSLWAKPALGRVPAQHNFKSPSESNRQNSRRTDGSWDPHLMIASLLKRTNGPHQTEGLAKETWRNLPADRFQQEHQLLLARLKNQGNTLDQAELEYIKNRADRYIATLTLLRQNTERIKSETDSNDPNFTEKISNADRLIEALTIQLGDWNNLQAQIENASHPTKGVSK